MKKNEPSIRFWREAGANTFKAAMCFLVVLLMALAFMLNNRLPINMGIWWYVVLASAIIGMGILPACMIVIRERKMEYVNDTNHALLKRYEDGSNSVRAGEIFWKKGGKLVPIEEGLGGFRRKSILIQEFTLPFSYGLNELCIGLKIASRAFDPGEYYQKVVLTGKKSYTQLVREELDRAYKVCEYEIRTHLRLSIDKKLTEEAVLNEFASVISFEAILLSNIISCELFLVHKHVLPVSETQSEKQRTEPGNVYVFSRMRSAHSKEKTSKFSLSLQIYDATGI